MVYKITIKINNNDIIFTTSTYSLENNRIIFRDKFGNKKNFSALLRNINWNRGGEQFWLIKKLENLV